MINFDKLKNHLKIYYKLYKKFPTIEFKNTNLENIANRLQVSSVRYNENDPMEVHIENVINKFQDSKTGLMSKVFDELDHVADLLANRINIAYSDINEVKSKADELDNKFNIEFNKLINNDEFMNKHYESFNDSNILSKDYNVINWEEISLVDTSSNILTKCNELLGKDLDSFSLTYVQRLIDIRNTIKGEREITVSNDVKTAFIDEFNQYIDILPEDIEYVFDVLTSEKKCKALNNKISVAVKRTIKKGESVIQVANYIRLFMSVNKTILDHLDMFSEELQDIIKSNVNIVNELLYICAYYLIVMRTQVFNNILVLPNGCLNDDTLSEFYAMGYEKEHIIKYEYLNYTLNNLQLPESGIYVKHIINVIDKLDNEFDEYLNKVYSEILYYKNKYLKLAMLKILKEYRLSVINDPNRDEPVILNTDELDNKINTCIDKLKFGIDSKDIFMDLIFDIQYHKSFGRYLYEKLNKGYLDKLSKSEIEYLSPSIINKININILINIILDFFKGRFLK